MKIQIYSGKLLHPFTLHRYNNSSQNECEKQDQEIHYMKKYFLCLMLLFAALLYSCRFNPESKNNGKNKKQASEAFSDDTIIDINISGANKKFRIDDSTAMALVRQVKEIKMILDYKYVDSTIFNEIYIDNVPTDSDNNWLINIVQFRPKTNHTASLLWLKVNANDGNIKVWDLPRDTIISLSTWIEMRTKKTPD
jgi:hypothetical protein